MAEDNIKPFKELAVKIKRLASQAVNEYAVIVNTLITSGSKDEKQIEHALDGMLDFCFDEQMLHLYKKLCRYYFDINPQATVSYINSYREMWDENK